MSAMIFKQYHFTENIVFFTNAQESSASFSRTFEMEKTQDK